MATADKTPVPMIPVATAEMLYVALGHVLAYVEANGTYPKHMAEGLQAVMRTYHRHRTDIMAKRGHGPESVQKYTAMARSTLMRWLGRQEKKREEELGDFDRWAKELDLCREDRHGEQRACVAGHHWCVRHAR